MNSIIQQYKNHFHNNYNHAFTVLLLCFFPVSFFFGTAVVNIFIILIDLFLLVEILRKKKFSFFKNFTFYSLIFLWLVLILNLFFSIDPQNSITRSMGFIRFVFFVMAIIYYFNINNKCYKKIILNFWSIIFIVTSIDLIFEVFYGYNTLGFKSYMYGRLSGFFNDELIAGHYYYAFIIIILTYINEYLSSKRIKLFNIKNIQFQSFFYFIIFLFFSVSFIIGERSNFIKVGIMLFLFIFLFEKKFFFKKIILLFSMIFVFLSISILHPDYKHRFIMEFKKPNEYFSTIGYIDHYKAGLKIFLDNKFTGVGLKNYRIETQKKNYINPSIHPHQTHIEILSELGLIGYLSFLIFFIINIYNYFKYKNESKNYQLAGFLFILTTFIPMLPSGSFFTSHAAALFWMNFAFMSFRDKIE